MVTLSSDTRPIIGRGPPLGARFVFLAILAIVTMIVDHRHSYLDTTRMWLSTAFNPLYGLVQAPSAAWEWLTGSFADRDRLRSENEQLQAELREARVKLLRFEALNEENQRLRALRDASAGVGSRTLIAEIVRVDLDPFRHRVLINKGARHDVYKGQPIIDAFGIVGQVVRVDNFTSQIILVSDAEHAIPVQVNRNGIRSIAVGTGDVTKLSLPFMTVESDVKAGDLLVSSGLDEIFPAGYPVATVTKVERDPAATFATVEAKPLAQLDRNREVLLLWPEAPPVAAEQASASSGTSEEASTPAVEAQ